MIQNVIRKTCMLTIPNFSWLSLLQELAAEGHVGVIYAAKNDLVERFGLDAEKVDPASLCMSKGFYGDLFLPDSQSTLYLKITGEKAQTEAPVTEESVWEDPGQTASGSEFSGTFELGEISPADMEGGEKLEGLIRAVDQYLKSHQIKSKDLNWADVGQAPDQKPPFDSAPATAPDKHSLDLAGIFRDGKLGDFLENFDRESRSIVLETFLEKTPNREETEYYIDKLFEADFLNEEIVVFCRKTHAATIRAKDRAALDVLAEQGIRCSCGTPIQEEEIQRLLILPEKSFPFISGTWAAKTFLVNILMKMGHKATNIHLSENVGGLELAFVQSGGSSFFFALCPGLFDEKSSQALQDALGEKKENLNVVVFGSKGVDQATADSLENEFGKDNFLVLESLDEFNTKLVDALNKGRLENILSVLGKFGELMSVDLASLALARIGD